MKNKSIDILGVRVDVFTIDQINDLIINSASAPFKKTIVIFKPYVEFISLASKNDEIKNLLNKSDYNIADSVAIQWAGSYLYGQPKVSGGFLSAYYSLLFRMRSKKWATQIIPERMAGVDQTIPLLKMADKKALKVGIVGGPEDIEITKKEISRRFKNIKLKVWSGYFSDSQKEESINDISTQKLDILFCAMGFPKQEKFIIENKSKLNAKVIIGEGGSFDYDQLGGNIKRAPKWMRKLGLEWLWRLLLQPKRFRRQLAIPLFIKKVRKEKKRIK
jgi:N-acetylglucosaminyldiphosphoundecaprenol N-acetyl-beta-D-mannosaminyltransferase